MRWIAFNPVNPNIAYFLTMYHNPSLSPPYAYDEIKMIDFSTPDHMVTHIAGAAPGVKPGDTRHPEYQGCYLDVFKAGSDTSDASLLQWQYTYRTWSVRDNSGDPTGPYVADTEYTFFNSTVSPEGCGSQDYKSLTMEGQVALLPAPAKYWAFGWDAVWYSPPVFTSDGEIMYLVYRCDNDVFQGILALNLTSGNMSLVINFWSDDNFGTPWYNNNNQMYFGTTQLSNDNSMMYIMTNGDWAASRNGDTEVWSLNLKTGEFKMVFDTVASLSGTYYSGGCDAPMVLSPDGKKMWFASDGADGRATVAFMNMHDFSGGIVYDRAALWPSYGYVGPAVTFESYYYASMTPDGKNVVIYDGADDANSGKNNIFLMSTAPPYNMHSIIGFNSYSLPGSNERSGEWDKGAEWSFTCPDRTCDGPVGFADFGVNFGAVSPGKLQQ